MSRSKLFLLIHIENALQLSELKNCLHKKKKNTSSLLSTLEKRAQQRALYGMLLFYIQCHVFFLKFQVFVTLKEGP